MRVDHVSYAAEPGGLRDAAFELAELLGVTAVDGGVHPRFGTRNYVLPLVDQRYIEVVDVLDHPASDKAPFGQAVRSRSQAGGGWLGWVIAVDDIAAVEARLSRSSVPGNRHRPDGVELRWRQIGVKDLITDPQLPFFIHWETSGDDHPSAAATGRITLESLEIAGDSARVADWIGVTALDAVKGITLHWVAPNGTPGIVAARFRTASGLVRI